MALPSYLSRHANLGFDADDISALLGSIQASQSESTAGELPHLPAEILLQILEFIPIDYVLDFRPVCKGFRNYIDTRVLYTHLRRTELLGFLGEDGVLQWGNNVEYSNDHEDLKWIHAKFSHVDDGDDPCRSNPLWRGKYAVFRLDDNWYDACARAASFDMTVSSDMYDFLDYFGKRLPHAFQPLGWCVRLDHGVLDMDLGKRCQEDPGIWFDFKERTVRVVWKEMLTNFLKSETAIRKKMDKTLLSLSDFTFGHHEDCLRAVRRQRIRTTLDKDIKSDRLIAWGMRLLPQLFGKAHYYVNPVEELVHFIDNENQTIRWLLLWRKDATMGQTQRDYLKRLADDRRAMSAELQSLNELFGSWKLNMYDAETEPSSYHKVLLDRFKTRRFVHLPWNPLAWSDEQVAKEEQRVRKWKGQKGMRTKMADLLKESNEALDLPEDVFDDMSDP